MPYLKTSAAALWVIAAGALGIFAPITTTSGWFMLAALATAPPLVVMRYWKQPAQTLSETIHQAIQ
jgi:hypothetical protein